MQHCEKGKKLVSAVKEVDKDNSVKTALSSEYAELKKSSFFYFLFYVKKWLQGRKKSKNIENMLCHKKNI